MALLQPGGLDMADTIRHGMTAKSAVATGDTTSNSDISEMVQKFVSIMAPDGASTRAAGMPVQFTAPAPGGGLGQQMLQSSGAASAFPGSAEVLQEVCTMTQPLNASLRKKYSIGGYYFLQNKK